MLSRLSNINLLTSRTFYRRLYSRRSSVSADVITLSNRELFGKNIHYNKNDAMVCSLLRCVVLLVTVEQPFTCFPALTGCFGRPIPRQSDKGCVLFRMSSLGAISQP